MVVLSSFGLFGEAYSGRAGANKVRARLAVCASVPRANAAAPGRAICYQVAPHHAGASSGYR
jgi:hypothetical protein